MKLQIQVRDGITAKLKSLPQKIQNRVQKEGLNEAGRIVAGEMASRAPVSRDPRLVPGLLQKAIGAKTKTYRRKIVVLVVGPRKGFRTNKKTKERKRTRFARVIGTRNGKELLQIPSKYAHLAGPGRKATFGREGARAGKRLAESVLAGKLRQALADQ
jgi:hypothetical protein